MFSDLMINTWIVATLVAAVAGFVGFFVVVRGSSFAAHALPLGAFPGAAAANLAGVDELIGLLAFSALGVVSITLLGRNGRQEVATALTLVALLGLGALCLSMTNEYSPEVYALLFGEVLGVGNAEILPVLAIGAVVVMVTTILFRPLLISSISPDLARARGVSSARMDFWFLLILALSTAAALPVVGALLVFSLMVGPASLARTITDRPFAAMMSSAGIAVGIAWLAIAISYQTDWPIGFFVGALGALAYAMGRGWRRITAAPFDGGRRLDQRARRAGLGAGSIAEMRAER